MSIEIREVGAESLTLYATISPSFRVESVFRVELIDKGLGGFAFCEEKVTLYMKYDDEDEKSGPASWPGRFDINRWGVFIAFDGSRTLGGAAVAIGIPAGMTTPFEREGAAVLWDIRVHPDERRHKIGSKLFNYAADWARQNNCRYMKIETQNVNVPACHFYARHGCKLGAIHQYGYASCTDVAHEAMLLWYLEL